MDKIDAQGQFVIEHPKKPLKINCTKEQLYDLFITQNKSYGDLMKIFNCSKDCVKQALRKYGIRKVDNNGARIQPGGSPTPPPTGAGAATPDPIAESTKTPETATVVTPIQPKTVTEDDTTLFKRLLKEAGGDFRVAVFNYCFARNVFYDENVVQDILKKAMIRCYSKCLNIILL